LWLEYFRIAKKVLTRHKFRSSLTVLSITIGAFSIVLMSSLANSGLTTLFAGIEELGGGRLLVIAPKQAEREEAKQSSYQHGLTANDADTLFTTLPHLVEHTMMSALGRQQIIADNGRMVRSDLVAGDGDFFAFTHLVPARGRFFDADDVDRHAKVCVVGHKLAQALWDGDAVGHTLLVDGLRCKVTAQATNHDYWGMDFDFDWLDFVAVPIDTLYEVDTKAYGAMAPWMKTDAKEHNEIVKRIANALLVDRHHGVDDFLLFDFAKLMAKFQSIFDIMETIVGFIAGIALVVGGVGVMNMMLVSVSERVREIGIRKAIGATPVDISRQFLLEAMVLAGVGGGIGVGGGVVAAIGASALIRIFKPTWVTVLPPGAIIAALVVSLGVGLVFGYFPARRAARLEAINAMRSA
jgi:putative ABC transport system permease protein